MTRTTSSRDERSSSIVQGNIKPEQSVMNIGS
jgi:hypothetical protein